MILWFNFSIILLGALQCYCVFRLLMRVECLTAQLTEFLAKKIQHSADKVNNKVEMPRKQQSNKSAKTEEWKRKVSEKQKARWAERKARESAKSPEPATDQPKLDG